MDFIPAGLAPSVSGDRAPADRGTPAAANLSDGIDCHTMVDSRQYTFEGARPAIDGTAHVSRDVTAVGDVTVAADASVWPGVVLRRDVGPSRVDVQSRGK